LTTGTNEEQYLGDASRSREPANIRTRSARSGDRPCHRGLRGGGNARHAVKALIVANEFLEGQAAELQAAVSNGHVRLPRDRKNWYD
jgi:hypothetical protein